MTTTTIQEMLDTMSVEELKNRLAAYMMADENLVSRPIGVEVRLADTLDRSGRYDVLIVLEDGSEKLAIGLHLHAASPSGLSAQKSENQQLPSIERLV